MLAALVVTLRSIALICRGHRAVAFESLALRQQLAVFNSGPGKADFVWVDPSSRRTSAC
jgi:hypothetical protein